MYLVRRLTPNTKLHSRRVIHTQITNPAQHTTDDIGKYFAVHPNVATLKTQAAWEEWGLTKETTLMVRQSSLDLVAELESLRVASTRDKRILVPGWIIGGPTGAGKSTMALYVLDYALKNFWLPIFVPNCCEWASGAETVRESCRKFLSLQYQLVNEHLSKICLDDPYLIERYKSDIHPSLNTIIEASLTGRIPIVEATLDFISAYRSNNQLPVMEITDNYHALHALDEFKMKLPDGSLEIVSPDKHPLAANFLAFSGNALTNGVAMCFTSSSFMGRGLMRDGDTKYFFRLPLYSNVEFEGCLSHYHELGVIPSNNDNDKLFVRKQTNAVPGEVREFSSFWNRYNEIGSAANLYHSDALARFLERVQRIMKRKPDIKDDMRWIGTSILGGNSQRPPQSWIDAGLVFENPLKGLWILLCPALQSALNTYASDESVQIVKLFLSNPATKGEAREGNKGREVGESSGDHTLVKSTAKPNDNDNSPSSKQLQLFSFSFGVYDRRHWFSTIIEEGSSSEFYGNIPQKLYKAAFGELPTDSKTLPNTTFFFCTTRTGPQRKDRTLDQIPDSACDSVCLVDGILLPSIVDELFRDLIIETVDHSNKFTVHYPL